MRASDRCGRYLLANRSLKLQSGVMTDFGAGFTTLEDARPAWLDAS